MRTQRPKPSHQPDHSTSRPRPQTPTRATRPGRRLLSPPDVLRLQRTIGNRATSRMLAGRVQRQPADIQRIQGLADGTTVAVQYAGDSRKAIIKESSPDGTQYKVKILEQSNYYGVIVWVAEGSVNLWDGSEESTEEEDQLGSSVELLLLGDDEEDAEISGEEDQLDPLSNLLTRINPRKNREQDDSSDDVEILPRGEYSSDDYGSGILVEEEEEFTVPQTQNLFELSVGEMIELSPTYSQSLLQSPRLVPKKSHSNLVAGDSEEEEEELLVPQMGTLLDLSFGELVEQFPDPTQSESKIPPQERLRLINKLVGVLKFAEIDFDLLQSDEVEPEFHSDTLGKIVTFYGPDYRYDTAPMMLKNVILRTKQRIQQLERGEDINVSELFHATGPSNLMGIATGSIEPRRERDLGGKKEEFQAAYVGPDPSGYGPLSFGFPRALSQQQSYYSEKNDQAEGNYGFKEGLMVNPQQSRVMESFANAIAGVLVSQGELEEGEEQYVHQALAGNFRIRYEGNQWVVYYSMQMAMSGTVERKIDSEDMLGNLLGNKLDVSSGASQKAASAAMLALATANKTVGEGGGNITGVNVMAPAEHELKYWQSKTATSDAISLEAVKKKLATAGVGMIDAEFIGMGEAKIEVEYMQKTGD